MSIASSKSGRKRSAEVGWELIINSLVSDHDTREMILGSISLEYTTPSDFLQSNRKCEFAEMIGMGGWEVKLAECIANVSFIIVIQ